MIERSTQTYRITIRGLTVIMTLAGARARDTHHLPGEGGCILVSNHSSVIDPCIMGWAASHRTLHYMAKEELFKYPLAAHFLRLLHSFPVARGRSDRSAFRKSLDLLQQGRVLAVFPEGTRARSAVLGPFQPGFAVLASRAAVPVVPAAISGFRLGAGGSGPLRVRFAPPRRVGEVRGKKFVELIRSDIERMLEESP